MKIRSIVLTTMLALVLPLVAAFPANAAGSAHRILVYGPSLWKGTSHKPLNEAELAKAQGYEVQVASAEKWASLTTEQFASYQAIVVGDPNCGSSSYPGDYLAPVLANRDAWSAAVTGPVIAAGNDPIYHQRYDGAVAFTNNALLFASSGTSTGMYFSLSCYFVGAKGGTSLKLFKGFGDFEVGGQGGDCNGVHVAMPDHPAMTGLTDEAMSNWGCSIHEHFDSYPADWVKLAGSKYTRKAIIVARGSTV
jgi:hypothetical protein